MRFRIQIDTVISNKETVAKRFNCCIFKPTIILYYGLLQVLTLDKAMFALDRLISLNLTRWCLVSLPELIHCGAG